MLTCKQLTQMFTYDPRTGEVFWAVNWGRKCPIGTRLGGVNDKGYVEAQIKGRRYSVHRVAWICMTGQAPPHEIDHINRDRADNRWANLRAVTTAQNAFNRSKYRTNTSGHPGVHTAGGRWRACISIGNKHKHLGTFDTIEEAVAVRAAAKAEYHAIHS